MGVDGCNKTLTVADGGTLALRSNLTDGAGGEPVAAADSVISEEGVNTSGTGTMRPNASSANFP